MHSLETLKRLNDDAQAKHDVETIAQAALGKSGVRPDAKDIQAAYEQFHAVMLSLGAAIKADSQERIDALLERCCVVATKYHSTILELTHADTTNRSLAGPGTVAKK